MRKFLVLLGTLGVTLAIASSPVVAHVGNNPHVGDPRYNNFANVNFEVVGFNGANFKDGLQNVDNNISGVHVYARDCSGNPGKCVKVLKNVNCSDSGGGPDQCGHISMIVHHDASVNDNLVFQYKSSRSVKQRDGCRAVQFALGAHLHNGDGCMNQGPGDFTTTICCGEGTAITDAYCAGCRPLPPPDFEDYIDWIEDND